MAQNQGEPAPQRVGEDEQTLLAQQAIQAASQKLQQTSA